MDTEPKGYAGPGGSTGLKVFENIDHFNDEEGRLINNPYTRDGSVDFYGQPALKEKSGGSRCAMLLIVNELLVTLAFTGVEVNMVQFSKSVLRQTNAEASNTYNRLMGTTYFFSLIGAFLSDSYLGRYLTCVIFQAVLLIGLVVLSLSTHLLLQPQGCGIIGFSCDPHTPIQLAMFYISIYLGALGYRASEPALATFGADQFDKEDPKESLSKTSFYSYFYVAENLGALVAETILVYIETMGDWVLAFRICACIAVFSLLFLLSGTLRYRNFKPSGNPISKFAQVMVASIRKMKLQLPTNGEGLYDIQEGDDSNGVRRMYHTHGLRFLDRAAIISAEDTSMVLQKSQAPNPWLLCSVTKVEEVKCFLRLLPLWLSTVFSSAIFIQMQSLFIEQGAAMHRTFLNIQIPPASMTAFDIIRSHGKPGWIPPNLNYGHLDRLFFLWAILAAINFIFFVVMAKRYKGIALVKREDTGEEEINITSNSVYVV
ncbi:hypothetical protein L6164_003678 [Bauhinia variegata]|uniref:Uncharacterized protein n=1 Tax=Bauhinia variegata TaxID=167791 RepID=A0ACB9Q237_BAUVA|nr:hypothetical protein L6164_003678 [Bauhinia variegata]